MLPYGCCIYCYYGYTASVGSIFATIITYLCCSVLLCPASLWGDPHLTTLDGADYTFNGYGEYRLISADDPASNSRSVVQVRTTPLPNTTATVLTHAAVGLYNLSNSGICQRYIHCISIDVSFTTLCAILVRASSTVHIGQVHPPS